MNIMKRFVVIAYDIENDKKRRTVVKLLQPWGVRVNKSVFECFLSDTELGKIKANLEKIATKWEDVILYYPLCRDCIDKRDSFGRVAPDHPVVKIF